MTGARRKAIVLTCRECKKVFRSSAVHPRCPCCGAVHGDPQHAVNSQFERRMIDYPFGSNRL